MHSLLKAFDDGFKSMEKAKNEEANDLETKKQEKSKKTAQKLEKIHSGISNLQALTSKLKLSFNDDDSSNVQTNEDVHTPNKTQALDEKNATQALPAHKNTTSTDKSESSIVTKPALAQSKKNMIKHVVNKPSKKEPVQNKTKSAKVLPKKASPAKKVAKKGSMVQKSTK